MSFSKLPFQNENGKKPAVYLTVDELTLLFGSVIEAKLKEFKPKSLPLPVKEEHLNYSQAVAFLKISKPTFTKLRKAGKIKGLKVGARRVLFNRSELEQYLQDNHE
ncbi:MAG: helix-turn-helix domain-containing protein [Arcicella sp.]|jgi:excisionase family DNA binding protein|nr:helix-turn-helix domain-containing protein [Arcicella sp.]